jgi:hypothetical protein
VAVTPKQSWCWYLPGLPAGRASIRRRRRPGLLLWTKQAERATALPSRGGVHQVSSDDAEVT